LLLVLKLSPETVAGEIESMSERFFADICNQENEKKFVFEALKVAESQFKEFNGTKTSLNTAEKRSGEKTFWECSSDIKANL
jgi:hypothetical protein